MTVTKDFPIHHCIYRNDPKTLEELLKDTENQSNINKRDNHGNTPIHLALMLNRHNCLMVLLKYNCDVFSRNNSGWNPIDEASMLGDIDVVEKISYLKWKGYSEKITQPGGLLDEWNKTTPYLYIKCKSKLKTSIPLLQKFNLKDINTVYKNGNSVKITTTIAGIDSRGLPKFIKGSISILLRYEESCGMFKYYLLNNKKKLYQEFFPNIPKFYLVNSLKSKIGANSIIKILTDLSNFSLKPRKGNILKKNNKTFTLENGKTYKAVGYKGKNIGFIIRKRVDVAIINECESIIQNKEKSKLKNNSKLFGIDHTTTNDNSKSSKILKNESDSDSNSDSESDSDSDSDSENEGNTLKHGKNKKTTTSKYDEKLNDYFDKTFNTNDNEANRTVTYTINKDGETKTFEYVSPMKDTLDWEQAYHEKYSQNIDVMHKTLGFGNEDYEKVKHLTPQEIEKLNLKKITEEEYFDPSSTKHIHLGRIMDINEEKKSYHSKVRFWMAKDTDDFPISIDNVKPLIKYVMTLLLDQFEPKSNSDALDNETYNILSTSLHNSIKENTSFPIKTIIPINPSFSIQYTCLDCSLDENSVPLDLFEIPNDYKPGDVYFEHIHK